MIDIHAHYDDPAFDADRDELLSGIFGRGDIRAVINAGCDAASSEASLALAARYGGMYAAVGIHPENASNAGERELAHITALLCERKAVALGEIGLDYHYTRENERAQKELFDTQLSIAEQYGKPVVIHERDAMADCLDIVLAHRAKGVFHSFSGSRETARILLERGYYISFSGTVTFKNARIPPENAAYVPEDRILTETDCPYLTAHPFRGRRNDSTYMEYTLRRIAEIRGVEYEYIEHITEANAARLFGLQ